MFMMMKNIIVLIAYTEYTKHVIFYLLLQISIAGPIFTVIALIFCMLTLNIPILFTAIPQNIVISPIHNTGYSALLKTLHNVRL